MIVFAGIVLLVIWIVVEGVKKSKISEEARCDRIKKSKSRLVDFKNRKR